MAGNGGTPGGGGGTVRQSSASLMNLPRAVGDVRCGSAKAARIARGRRPLRPLVVFTMLLLVSVSQ